MQDIDWTGVAKLLALGQIWPSAFFFFLNKVLLEHSHAHSFTYYLWLLLPVNVGVK